MLRKLRKSAQTTAEYAILIAIVVGAVVAMQVYVRRGIQGRIRAAVDYVGSADTNAIGDSQSAAMFQNNTQYEPYYASSEMDVSRNTSIADNMQGGGAATKTFTADSSSRTGSQTSAKGRARND